MIIVLDTTEFVRDPWVEKTSLRLLAENLDRIGARVCVPELVVEETVNHYRRSVRKIADTVTAARNESSARTASDNSHSGFLAGVSVLVDRVGEWNADFDTGCETHSTAV